MATRNKDLEEPEGQSQEERIAEIREQATPQPPSDDE